MGDEGGENSWHMLEKIYLLWQIISFQKEQVTSFSIHSAQWNYKKN